MGAEYRLIFATIHWQRWRLHEWNILELDEKSQTSENQLSYISNYLYSMYIQFIT